MIKRIIITIVNILSLTSLAMSMTGCGTKSRQTSESCRSEELGKVQFFPSSGRIEKDVTVLKTEDWSEQEKVTAYSLQGLVNRHKNCIYILESSSKEIHDFYKAQGYLENETLEDDLWKAVKRFQQYFDGFVAYDHDDFFQIDLATNISGVENRLIIPAEKTDHVKSLFGEDCDILDLSAAGLDSVNEMHDWYIRNIFPKQNKEVLAIGGNMPFHNVYRDYLIEFKIPVFWVPGNNDADYDAEYEKKILELLEATPENIPVMGFWPAFDNGKSVGYDEYTGVGLAGRYGKFTVVNDWVGNYSFLSGARMQDNEYVQTKVRSKKMRGYDPDKKYVALIMIESGDAASYMQSLFGPNQWNQEHRQDVPVSYGINPSMQYLLPAQLKYLYDTATENNFFFCSISGAGYCYPLEGYGSNTADPQNTLDEYLRLTERNMRQMDMDMLGIYTHPGRRIDGKDSLLLARFAEVAPSIRSYILGMHLVDGYDAGNSHGVINGNASWHHTITNLLHTYVEELPLSEAHNRDYDQMAADILSDRIRKASENGQFIQAMFYSWTYGPRRLYYTMKQLEKEGYVFVTLNEFDHLFRLSENVPQT